MTKRYRVLRRAVATTAALACVAIIGATVHNATAEANIPTRPIGGLNSPDGPAKPARTGVVKDRYIVVLKDGRATSGVVRAAAAELTKAAGGNVRVVYDASLRGFSADLTAAQAARMATNATVRRVEPVRYVSANDTQSNPPSWGLDRIDQVSPVLDNAYTATNGGAGVTAYVIDSGINIAHDEFGGRASYGFDAMDDDPATPPEDCVGHGTHVAGTIGGATYGVANAVNLVAVRVLGCDGSGTTEQVLAGIDWVTANAVKPAVANMSLGGDPDPVLDAAVQNSIASGIVYTVSAGNDWADACSQSPASVADAITVGATDRFDYRAYFSNIGPCVDLFAPGVSIRSASIGSTSATEVHSGTSMAAPHAAGAAAQLLAANPALTPQEVRDGLLTTAIAGGVHDNESSSNRLLHLGAVPVARAGVSLFSYANGKFVTAESAGTKPLIANRKMVGGTWEQYDFIDAGGGLVALKSRANGKYVTAESAGTKPLIANRTAVGAWEKFQVVSNPGDGTVSLIANINGKYVTAEGAGTKPLIANRTAVGLWEKFDITAPNPVVSIQAGINSKYVSSPNTGLTPLTANRTVVGPWEKYTLVDLGGGVVALRAGANGKFVTAPSGGTKPLMANKSGVDGAAEAFYYDYLADDAFIIVALVNNRAVTAEAAGAKPLIARADPLAPGTWEVFFFTTV